MYNEEYLAHYGVKGMKWGVRRASKQLARAKTSEDRDKAVDKLNYHRDMASYKIKRLQKKRVKLDTVLTKSMTKDATKAAKLERKASKLDMKIAKNQKKAAGFFTSEQKAQELLAKNSTMQNKSNILHAKAKTLNAKYAQAKAKVEANENLTQAFKQGVNDIDQALINAGRKYVNG